MSFDFGSYSGIGDLGTINVYADSAPPSISQDSASQLATSLNNQFLTQAPELTYLLTGNMPNFSSLPNAAQFQSVANQLVQDQSKMSQTANSLINQVPQIQQDYANYQQTYNDNIARYNLGMKYYQNAISAMSRYGDVGGLSGIAQKELNAANQHKAAIDNAFQTYQSAVDTYNNDYKTLQQTYNDYTSTYKDLTNKVTEAQTQVSDPTRSETINQSSDTSTTGSGGVQTPPDIGAPVATPSDPNAPSSTSGVPGFGTGEAGIPGIGGVGKGTGGTGTGKGTGTGTGKGTGTGTGTGGTGTGTGGTGTGTGGTGTGTGTVDEPIAPPAIEDPTIKKVDDWNIEIYPLFPPERSTLTKSLKTSTLGGGGSASGASGISGVGAVLGSGSAPNPDTASGPILGKDDKSRQVWNEESLKSALGI